MRSTLSKAPWLCRGYVRILFALALSVCFLAVCSKSSFLYPMNDWVDVNCFFTVGRGLAHGKTLYVDLYEQKGPLLYFVFALLSLLSETSFLPIYLLEVMCFALFLYYAGKCVDLYTEQKPAGYLAMLVLAAVIPVSRAFAHGCSVEELSLCMVMYSLYSVLRAVREKRCLALRETLLIGFFAGVALWSKYTICGFYLGLAVFVLIWYPADKRTGRQLLAAIGQFLLGVGAASAPVLAYFACHHAFSALWEAYFYNNLFRYTNFEASKTILRFGYAVYVTLYENLCYTILLTMGMFWLLKDLRIHWRESTAVYLSFAMLVLTTYVGGRSYVYYGLILSAYAVFGLIALGRLWQRIHSGCRWKPKAWLGYAATAAACAVLLATVYTNSGNVYLMAYQKADLPQYRFAETINKVENATMLQYGGLDGGFYYAAEKEPVNRFFCVLNLSLPEMWTEQDRMVESGVTDFVVTRGIQLEGSKLDRGIYTQIDRMDFFFETEQTYYLYQRVSTP